MERSHKSAAPKELDWKEELEREGWSRTTKKTMFCDGGIYGVVTFGRIQWSFVLMKLRTNGDVYFKEILNVGNEIILPMVAMHRKTGEREVIGLKMTNEDKITTSKLDLCPQLTQGAYNNLYYFNNNSSVFYVEVHTASSDLTAHEQTIKVLKTMDDLKEAYEFLVGEPFNIY